MSALEQETLSPVEALAVVANRTEIRVSTGEVTRNTAEQLATQQSGLVRYLLAKDIQDVSAVGQELVDGFRWAPSGPDLKAPGLSARRKRLWAARNYFQVLASLGLIPADPTVGLPGDTANGENSVATRPLTDGEHRQGQAFAAWTPADTRGPTAWALGQAMATPEEAGLVCVGDVAVTSGRVWLPGTSRRLNRWGELTSWGAAQVERRLEAIHAQTEFVAPSHALMEPLALDTSTALPGRVLYENLARASLLTDPAVRAGSLAAWAGRSFYDRTGDVLETTRRLGHRSVNDAIRFIGLTRSSGERPPQWRRVG